MKRFLFSTLAMLVLIACSDDPGNAPRPTERVNLVIRASIDGYEDMPISKTTIEYGNPDYAAGERSEWVEGDEIAVFFYDDIAVDPKPVARSVFKAQTSGTNVKFEWVYDKIGTMPTTGTYDVKAISPERMAGLSSGSFQQTQTGKNANHIGSYDIMSVQKEGVDISDPNALNLSFKHELPLLRFSLKNTDAKHNISIQSIEIRSSKYLSNGLYTSLGYNGFYTSLGYTDIKGSSSVGAEKESFSLNCFPFIEIEKAGGIEDFYMLAKNTVEDATDDFIISVRFEKNGANGVQEFSIPRGENPFLQVPFADGNRYYFKLAVSGTNLEEYTDTSGVIYTINTETNEARVKSNWFAAGAVTILATLPGHLGSIVTSIDESAFYRNSSLTEVTLPASIESIGRQAFIGCSNLTAIIFDGGSNLKTIGANAFELSGLTSITIPASVEGIGGRAFWLCSGLESITFEASSNLRSIGDGAFSQCDHPNLTNITIPSPVSAIGGSAFGGCAHLATVDLPATLTSIGTGAFGGTGLTNVSLHSAVPPTLGTPTLSNSIFGYLTTTTVDNKILTIRIPATADLAAYNAEFNDPDHPKGWKHTSPVGSINLTSEGTVELIDLSGVSNKTSYSGEGGIVTIKADL